MGVAALDERRPQPVVDVRVADVAHYVRPPIDTLKNVKCILRRVRFRPLKRSANIICIIDSFFYLIKICKALFHPAWRGGIWPVRVFGPVQHLLLK